MEYEPLNVSAEYQHYTLQKSNSAINHLAISLELGQDAHFKCTLQVMNEKEGGSPSNFAYILSLGFSIPNA